VSVLHVVHCVLCACVCILGVLCAVCYKFPRCDCTLLLFLEVSYRTFASSLYIATQLSVFRTFMMLNLIKIVKIVQIKSQGIL